MQKWMQIQLTCVSYEKMFLARSIPLFFNLPEIYHNLLDLHNASVTVAKKSLSIIKQDNKKVGTNKLQKT